MAITTSLAPQGQAPTDGATEIFALLDEFWCSDCLTLALFERVLEPGGAAATSEWACTSCGAAYFDGIGLGIGELAAGEL